VPARAFGGGIRRLVASALALRYPLLFGLARREAAGRAMKPLSPELLEILACPDEHCRAALRQEADRLICTGCGRRYPCEDRWPVLIPEEADGATPNS